MATYVPVPEDENANPARPIRAIQTHMTDCCDCMGSTARSAAACTGKTVACIVVPILVIGVVIAVTVALVLHNMGWTAQDFTAMFRGPDSPLPPEIHRFASYSLAGPWQSAPTPSMAGYVSWGAAVAYNVSWTGVTGVAAVALVIRPRAGSAPVSFVTLPDTLPGYHALGATALDQAVAAWNNGDWLFLGLFRASPPTSATGLLYAEII